MERGISYIGKRIGSYRVISELGRGSFGSVYLANHSHLNRTIAIKILHSSYSSSLKEREAFFQEAQFLDSLKHRHILPLLDVGIQDDFIYMMLEYAPNGSLLTRIEKQSPIRLPMKETLLILSQVGQALEYAHTHRHPVVHRDVKPSNILFNEKGEALLADFGIAVSLEGGGTKDVGSIEGSYPYMAPEQFHGQASVKSDQYALGCIAYELLTGYKPILASANIRPDVAWMEWRQRHEQDKPAHPRTFNPDISRHASDAVIKALEKDRTRRHVSIAAFIGQLTSDTRLLDLSEIPTFSLSLSTLEKMPAISRKTDEQWISEGNKFYREGQFEEAIVAFKQAIQQGHNDAQIFYLLGNILRKLNKLDEALDAYGNAIELNPKNDLFYSSSGNVLYELERYKEAFEAYKQAIQLAPEKAISYKNQADVLQDLGNYKEALESYEKALQLGSGNNILMVKAYIGKGDTLLKLRNRGEALHVYEQAIKIEPTNIVLHTMKGDILWMLKRNEEALQSYERALKLDPHNADLYHKKGSALMPLGRAKEAQQAYEMARKLNAGKENHS